MYCARARAFFSGWGNAIPPLFGACTRVWHFAGCRHKRSPGFQLFIQLSVVCGVNTGTCNTLMVTVFLFSVPFVVRRNEAFLQLKNARSVGSHSLIQVLLLYIHVSLLFFNTIDSTWCATIILIVVMVMVTFYIL